MKFTAVGDAIIQRRIQEKFEGYDELRPFIMQGDARFFNLETTLNYEGECPASQFSGGTYIRAVPEVLNGGERGVALVEAGDKAHAMQVFREQYSGQYHTVETVEKLFK